MTYSETWTRIRENCDAAALAEITMKDADAPQPARDTATVIYSRALDAIHTDLHAMFEKGALDDVAALLAMVYGEG